jgi:hypothetical protein
MLKNCRETSMNAVVIRERVMLRLFDRLSRLTNLVVEYVISYKDSETPAKRVRAKRHCSCYSKVRHNFCTYKVEIENVDNSKESKV